MSDLVFLLLIFFFFLMIRRPPRSTQSRSSAASDVYKRQEMQRLEDYDWYLRFAARGGRLKIVPEALVTLDWRPHDAVSYTHLRAHETVLDLVCRLLLEKTKNKHNNRNRESSTEHINVKEYSKTGKVRDLPQQ